MISSQTFTHHVLTNISPNIPKPTLENTISPITGWNIEWQQSSTMFSMNHKAVNRRTISPRHSVQFWVWLGRFKTVIAQETHPKNKHGTLRCHQTCHQTWQLKIESTFFRSWMARSWNKKGTQKELNGLSSHGCLITNHGCVWKWAKKLQSLPFKGNRRDNDHHRGLGVNYFREKKTTIWCS